VFPGTARDRTRVPMSSSLTVISSAMIGGFSPLLSAYRAIHVSPCVPQSMEVQSPC
jgi:hypothetical protein